MARQEADRCKPDFSESRHGRIMVAVASAEPASLRIADASRPFRRSVAIPLGLAAMIGLAMLTPTIVRWIHPVGMQARVNHPEREPVVIVDSRRESPLPAIDQAAHQVNVRVQDAVQTAMAERQWVGLDHDVRLATHYFVDQAPIRSAIDLGNDEARQ